jgi:CelD/BcsL family acetyltransferase involved in cellulose biosynthesis
LNGAFSRDLVVTDRSRMADSASFVECVDLEGAERRREPWRELCGRPLVANVFAEPAFLVNAARHLPDAPALDFLFVWESAQKDRLIGVAAVDIRSGRSVAQVWQSEQAGLPALVLDGQSGAKALSAALAWLSEKRSSIVGLFAPTLEAEGPIVRLLQASAARIGGTFLEAHPRRRAMLSAARDRPDYRSGLSAKRLKEWRRLRRRLDERGARFVSVDGPAAAGEPFERFLALESKGWKGRRGAPLAADPGRTAFARALAADTASEGRMRVDRLDLGAATIAAGVVLASGDRAFYWKTAFDESLAEYSPGALLTIEISDRLQHDPAIAIADSCAIEGHPMIDRLWPERLSLVDCLVAVRPGQDARLKRWLARRELLRSAKARAKRLLLPLIGRKLT